MRKCFGLAMLIVGTIIGAGFASGKEAVVFFGRNMSLWIAPLCGLCFFALSVLFLTLGSRINKPAISAANVKLLGRLHIFADAFLLFNSLVIFSGMLSGMNALLDMIYPISPFYSIASGILGAVVVSKGLRGIIKCNCVTVPLIVILLITICSFNIDGVLYPLPFNGYSVVAAGLYVSMNMMLTCTFFITAGKIDRKTIVGASAFAAIILSCLLLVLILALRENTQVHDMPMPLLALASETNKILFYVCITVVAVSIFTTMLTAMSTLSRWVAVFGGGEIWSIIVVLVAGLIVSNLGFENVVGYMYPAIGVAGIAYIAAGIVYIVRTQKSAGVIDSLFDKGNDKIHRGGKNAKNDG